MDIKFEWDEEKASSNLRKHGIGFETATHVFTDPLAVTIQDRIEGSEMRWQTIGMVGGCLLVMVAHTTHFDDIEVIRIISARKADKSERKRYEHG